MFEEFLRKLERSYGHIYIEHFALVLVGLKILGVFITRGNPIAQQRMYLVPELVLAGEWWRLFGFLCIPLSSNLFWMFFELMLLYLYIQGLEQAWGTFKVNIYYLIAYAATVLSSFMFNMPIGTPFHMELTLMLGFAALYPDFQLLLFFIIPVKIKWIAIFTWVYYFYLFLTSPWSFRGYLLILFTNYFLFFGPGLLKSVRLQLDTSRRRRKFKKAIKESEEDLEAKNR